MLENIDIIIAIACGIAALIPLVIKLIKCVKTAIQNKNWDILVSIVVNLMAEAEEKFETGADRKEWVLAMISSMSDSINCEIDIEQISKLIDSLCAMAKIVNTSKK